MKLYRDKEQNVFGEEQMREVERAILLRNVDIKWMDHLEAMDSLMESVGLQAYAQRKPIAEYRIQGADLFDEMITMIRDDTVRMILSVVPKSTQVKRVEVARPVRSGFMGQPVQSRYPRSRCRFVPKRRSAETTPVPAEAERNIKTAVEPTRQTEG